MIAADVDENSAHNAGIDIGYLLDTLVVYSVAGHNPTVAFDMGSLHYIANMLLT